MLNHNPSFRVVVTARSEEKGRRIVESVEGEISKNVSYVVVEDIAKDNAFDKVPFNPLLLRFHQHHTLRLNPLPRLCNLILHSTT